MYQSLFKLYQLIMATIRARKRTDGSISYTAQIRLFRDGVQVYQESQTFARKQAAQAWVRKRQVELDRPGAIERANRTGATIKEMIDRYLLEYEKLRPLGKTRRATLKAIGETWLGKLQDREVTSQKFVEYADGRMMNDGIQALTVGNDLAHLGAVLSVARPAWGYDIDPMAMPDARKVLRKMGAAGRPVTSAGSSCSPSTGADSARRLQPAWHSGRADALNCATATEQPPTDFHKARAFREHNLAQMTEIELHKARGMLVDKAAVEMAAHNAGRHLRDQLFGPLAQQAHELAAMTDPWLIEKYLNNTLRRTLEEAERMSCADLEHGINAS